MSDDSLPSLAPSADPILLHPPVHGLDLLDTHSSLLVHLVVVLTRRDRHKFQPKFEAHQPPLPLSTFQGMGSFVTQTTLRPHKSHPTLTLIQLPRTSTHAHHPSQQVSQSKIQAKFIYPHSLSKEDQQMMFQAKTRSQRHLHAL